MPDHRPELPLRRAPRPSPDAALDLDLSRRPGVPRERPPEPWPDARAPVRAMRAPPAVSTHGRPGKQPTPVYSTATPPRGASGLLRRTAYRYPDHWTRHWTLLLLADPRRRCSSWATACSRRGGSEGSSRPTAPRAASPPRGRGRRRGRPRGGRGR